MRALGMLAALALLACGCASGPARPQPGATTAQLVVHLDGQAREGVKGPKTTAVLDGYNTFNESVEKGNAFARVNYRHLEDVIVLVDGSMAPAATTAQLELDGQGFERVQYVAVAAGGKPARLLIHNDTGAEVHVCGFSDEAGFEVAIAAGAQAEVQLSALGAYELCCDELEAAATTVHVTGGLAWQGESDEEAFFDGLKPGACNVTVLAPRLPVVRRTIQLTAGRRETVVAPLTVNTLPRAGK